MCAEVTESYVTISEMNYIGAYNLLKVSAEEKLLELRMLTETKIDPC